MAEHTPGPWSLAVSADRTPLVVAPGRSTGVAIIPFQRDEVCRQARIEETGANARLIAAAPELLEAARAALDDLISDGHAHYRVAEVLRAAIAKATGGSHA